jgi:heat-inducible transcriptional repressor
MTSPTPDLNPRQRQVLTALVDHYIVRAEPVSSSLLSQSAVVRASSATIRNTLADLEERGFVAQPHTSSGRLPTDRGYRAYVNDLMHPEPLAADDKRALDAAIPPVPEAGAEDPAGAPARAASAEARLAGAVQGLADQTRLLGLVLPPPPTSPVFRKASLVHVEESKVALVLADSGSAAGTAVRSLLLDTRDVSIFRLEAIVKRLNDDMQGRPVSLLNDYLKGAEAVTLPTDEKDAIGLLGRSILKLSQEKTGEDVLIAGARNLVNRPDFANSGDLDSIFGLLESKVTLVHFLRQREGDGENGDVHVTIGEERGPDGRLFRSLSLVTASFSGGGTSRGLVGVLGPKRIPYARLVPMVDYAARRLDINSGSGGAATARGDDARIAPEATKT